MSEKGSIFSEQTKCVGFASGSGVFPARHSGGGGGEIAVTGASAEIGVDNALATKNATSASTVADVPQKKLRTSPLKTRLAQIPWSVCHTRGIKNDRRTYSY